MSSKRKVSLNILSEVVNLETGTQLGFDKLRSNDFINKLGEGYTRISIDSCYSNELFVNFYIKMKEWQGLLAKDDVLIETGLTSNDGVIWNDLAGHTNSTYLSFFSAVYLYFMLVVMGIGVLGYCIFKTMFTRKLTMSSCSNIAFVRSRATAGKIHKVSERFNFLCVSEGLTFHDKSMPSLFNLTPLYFLIIKLPSVLVSACIDLHLIRKELGAFLKPTSVNKISKFYLKRILLKTIYEAMISFVVKKHKRAKSDLKIYTGNKEDRFAMVEYKVARQYQCELICIPHGLEYSFKFPTGVTGNTFYCTSDASKVLMSRIYQGNHFIFDAGLNRSIYSCSEGETTEGEPEIYFFTESRDISVNQKIITLLNKSGIKFKVKLHPADSASNYENLNIEIESDYNKSLINSICIARKSTVLLEALYNNSVAIAFLINSKDDYYATHVFPSLSDSKIKKVFTIEELILHLKKGKNSYV